MNTPSLNSFYFEEQLYFFYSHYKNKLNALEKISVKKTNREYNSQTETHYNPSGVFQLVASEREAFKVLSFIFALASDYYHQNPTEKDKIQQQYRLWLSELHKQTAIMIVNMVKPNTLTNQNKYNKI